MEASGQSEAHPHEIELIKFIRQKGAVVDRSELRRHIEALKGLLGRTALQFIGDPSTEPPTQPQTIESIALERNAKPPHIRDSLRQSAEEIAKRVNFTRVSKHCSSGMDAIEIREFESELIDARYNYRSGQGLCDDENSHFFIADKPYEGRDAKFDRIEQAKAICERCPVRDPCLQDALDNGGSTIGVYGGTTEHERREMLRKAKRSRSQGRT